MLVRVSTGDQESRFNTERVLYATGDQLSAETPPAWLLRPDIEACTLEHPVRYGDCRDEFYSVGASCECESGFEVVEREARTRLSARFEEGATAVLVAGFRLRVGFGASAEEARGAEGETHLGDWSRVLAQGVEEGCLAIHVIDRADEVVNTLVECARAVTRCEGEAPVDVERSRDEGCTATGSAIAPWMLVLALLGLIQRRSQSSVKLRPQLPKCRPTDQS